MTSNSWIENSPALVAAYARHNDGILGALRQRLLARALSVHMPPWPQRVIDIGGGEGHQAISLARGGHNVVLLDPDPAMLEGARRRLADEEQAVRNRVALVHGYGENAPELTDGTFDMACCHGILMYLDDPVVMLQSVVSLVRPGGLISVLAMNADAIAMRPGLQGRWADANVALTTGEDNGARHIAGRTHTVGDVEAILTAAGAPVLTWYGMRIFSDHLGDATPGPDFDELCELEWAAGVRDPYRRVARLFHLIAQRNAG